MNLNEIWSGNDYAYYEWKGRNENFRHGAPRVKAIRVYKRREYGKERESGYVEVMRLEPDGTPRLDRNGNHITMEVRARDIAMRWEEYEEERDHREAQAEKIARENAEREAREQQQKQLLLEKFMEKYGIPQRLIYNVTTTGIHISRAAVEEELGIAINQ